MLQMISNSCDDDNGGDGEIWSLISMHRVMLDLIIILYSVHTTESLACFLGLQCMQKNKK